MPSSNVTDQNNNHSGNEEQDEKPNAEQEEKPDLNVPPPEYDALTEGYDPDQIKREIERNSEKKNE